jgi:hypothetical protein
LDGGRWVTWFDSGFFLTDSTEAVEFGKKMLTPFGKIPKYVEKLEVHFS